MEKIPYHIAVIMDGNGRWAQAKKLPRTAGHYAGIKRVKEIIRESKRLGVKILTVFAFSTENWLRPKKEILFLFRNMQRFLDAYKEELMREDIRFKVIGRRDRISKEILEKVQEIETTTRDNRSFYFNVAVDYGGRWEIIEAVKKLVQKAKDNGIAVDDINEEYFRKYLVFDDMPDPDLLIRTSGEQRISNFLLWNLAYSELYFPQVLWPDFNAAQLAIAIEIYNKRERRFGTIKKT